MDLTVSGTSPRLEFGWPRVAGAEEYVVVVLDDAGHAAWSWTGEATSVTPPPHAPMPSNGSATVAAFDARRAPLGLSDPVEF